MQGIKCRRLRKGGKYKKGLPLLMNLWNLNAICRSILLVKSLKKRRYIFCYSQTRFTVLIFSDKGNKQAGEITLDVSELLNAKQKSMKMQKGLDKCPDKNAKMSFTLSVYIKEEVQPDNVSERSYATNSNNMSMLSQSNIQPDFKKKRNDDGDPLSPRLDLNQRAPSN